MSALLQAFSDDEIESSESVSSATESSKAERDSKALRAGHDTGLHVEALNEKLVFLDSQALYVEGLGEVKLYPFTRLRVPLYCICGLCFPLGLLWVLLVKLKWLPWRENATSSWWPFLREDIFSDNSRSESEQVPLEVAASRKSLSGGQMHKQTNSKALVWILMLLNALTCACYFIYSRADDSSNSMRMEVDGLFFTLGVATIICALRYSHDVRHTFNRGDLDEEEDLEYLGKEELDFFSDKLNEVVLAGRKFTTAAEHCNAVRSLDEEKLRSLQREKNAAQKARLTLCIFCGLIDALPLAILPGLLRILRAWDSSPAEHWLGANGLIEGFAIAMAMVLRAFLVLLVSATFYEFTYNILGRIKIMKEFTHATRETAFGMKRKLCRTRIAS
eukprot:gene21034-25242_t